MPYRDGYTVRLVRSQWYGTSERMLLSPRDLPRLAETRPDLMIDDEPRYAVTYCSQCGGEFGPGDCGYSHCEHHRRDDLAVLKYRRQWAAVTGGEDD